MKKIKRLIIMLASCLIYIGGNCHAADISVTLNANVLDFDVKPQIIEGRTMVPLRAIFEALGAEVLWDDATKTVTSTKDNVTVKLTIGSKVLDKNGTKIELDVPAQIVDSFTLVPVRAISEAFGCNVDWDDKTKTVIIKYEETNKTAGAIVENADAENNNTYGFRGYAADISCVPDPLYKENNVYFVDASVSEKTSYTYIRIDTKFEAGCQYLIEYDVMMGTDALGNVVKSPQIGTCFNYANPGATRATDHAVGATKVSSDSWTHVRQTYTVPKDFVSSYGGNFGIYGQPSKVDGVDYQVAVDFYVDNITVIPLDSAPPAKDESIIVLKKAFQVDTADAENDNTYDFYPLNSTLTCVPDPVSENNNVYFLDSTVSDKIAFTYIRIDANFEPGCEYLVEYDVMMGTDALGNAVKNPQIGTCFRYADPGTTWPKDHATGSTKVSSDKWTHVKQTHTVPKDFVSSYGGSFGIYGQPCATEGVDYQVAVDFYVDNIKITPLNSDTQKQDSIEYLKTGDIIYFEGSTTKNPLEYAAGETMTFKLSVKKGSSVVLAPYIFYSCEGDDGKKTSGYVAVSEDGCYYFDTKCERDGFVRVTARICDANRRVLSSYQIFEGGAGADIDKIKIDTVEPDDYLKFWENLKKTAFSLKNEVLYESDNVSTNDKYIAKDMRLKTAEGAGDYASFIYTYPKDAKPGSLKLKMTFQGYNVTGVSPSYEDGYIVVSVCAHDIPNLQSAAFYSNLQSTKYSSYGMSKDENAKPETSYWWKMFVRDMQIFNYFKSNTLFNGKDVEFSGGSQGAFQACNMAAHCGMATYCNITVPWFANIFGPVLNQRMAGWSPAPVDGLCYFDTAVAAKYLKCKTDIVAGLGDYTCPPSTIMATYNNMSCEKSLTFRQNMTHSYQPPVFSKYTISSK